MRFKFYDKENDVEVWVYGIEEVEFRRNAGVKGFWSYSDNKMMDRYDTGMKTLEGLRQSWIEEHVKFEKL